MTSSFFTIFVFGGVCPPHLLFHLGGLVIVFGALLGLRLRPPRADKPNILVVWGDDVASPISAISPTA